MHEIDRHAVRVVLGLLAEGIGQSSESDAFPFASIGSGVPQRCADVFRIRAPLNAPLFCTHAYAWAIAAFSGRITINLH